MDEKLESTVLNDDMEVEQQQVSETNMIPLPTGRPLTALDTYKITASEESRFIVIMGSAGCGKTTLVTSLYQLFLKEDLMESFCFAGSETIVAFEERAFDTRTSSQGVNPETLRTPRGSLDNILHIRIMKYIDRKYINLLLSDFSGEDYESVSGNPSAARENFSLVKSAKILIVLLDGNNLVNLRSRQVEIQKAIHMIKTFKSCNLIHQGAVILLVISKYDLIINTSESEIKEFIDSIIQEFSDQIPELEKRIRLMKTAAMPKDTGKVPFGFGLLDLLSFLVKDIRSMTNTNQLIELKTPSQFDLYGMRDEYEF